MMFKLVVYTFKALHGSAPTYIRQLIRLKPQSNYNLRSNTKCLLLDLPNKTKKTNEETGRSLQLRVPCGTPFQTS